MNFTSNYSSSYRKFMDPDLDLPDGLQPPLTNIIVTSDYFYFEFTPTCDLFARLAFIEEKILWYKQKLVETNWRKSGLVLSLRLRVHFNVPAIFFSFYLVYIGCQCYSISSRITKELMQPIWVFPNSIIFSKRYCLIDVLSFEFVCYTNGTWTFFLD